MTLSRQVDCGKDRHPLPLVCVELREGIRPPAGLAGFFGFAGAPGLLLAHVDQGGIDHILEVGRVVLLDHLDAGAADQAADESSRTCGRLHAL